MTCIYCWERPQDPAHEPYCGLICAINAGSDPVGTVPYHGMLKLSTLPELAAHARPCWRKIRYNNREEAEVHVFALVSRGVGGDVSRLRPYHCNHCGDWHVGHRCVTSSH